MTSPRKTSPTLADGRSIFTTGASPGQRYEPSVKKWRFTNPTDLARFLTISTTALRDRRPPLGSSCRRSGWSDSEYSLGARGYDLEHLRSRYADAKRGGGLMTSTSFDYLWKNCRRGKGRTLSPPFRSNRPARRSDPTKRVSRTVRPRHPIACYYGLTTSLNPGAYLKVSTNPPWLNTFPPAQLAYEKLVKVAAPAP